MLASLKGKPQSQPPFSLAVPSRPLRFLGFGWGSIEPTKTITSRRREESPVSRFLTHTLMKITDYLIPPGWFVFSFSQLRVCLRPCPNRNICFSQFAFLRYLVSRVKITYPVYGQSAGTWDFCRFAQGLTHFPMLVARLF